MDISRRTVSGQLRSDNTRAGVDVSDKGSHTAIWQTPGSSV